MSDHLVWQLLKALSWRTVKLNTILQCILYLKILQKKILYPFPCRPSINILQKIKYEDFFTIIRRIKIAPKEYSCHQLIFYCLIITCTTLIKYKSLFVNSQFGDMIETTLSKQKKKKNQIVNVVVCCKKNCGDSLLIDKMMLQGFRLSACAKNDLAISSIFILSNKPVYCVDTVWLVHRIYS